MCFYRKEKKVGGHSLPHPVTKNVFPVSACPAPGWVEISHLANTNKDTSK